ncbi:branched-chain amino acid ABC transporter permease [Salinadaptatus halalkaliphilus]|uniref:Branched-chain amino acid ABC transporter permease n=1 Tax=Salinadaptatus halalkaliphilus TaxID=2419781 RepID=A0A4S3TKS0_9EURY|nr:branched-chain amino acid ABC transporter permease [Salinadaptatus halalkaliphilus]THE64636.1 branched-chain amino acid ABC transporter permease [Salinadaptatus halalkaliphilus]
MSKREGSLPPRLESIVYTADGDGYDWRLAWGIVAVLLVAIPWLGAGTFELRILIGVLMWIGLAQSWNMIGGYAGYLDFGHGAYFGIGAFVTGIAMVSLSLPFLPALVLAGIFGAVFAYAIGVPTLRLKGAYFAIATWAFAEAMRQLALLLDITGGTSGLTLPSTMAAFGIPLPDLPRVIYLYYIMLVLSVGVVVLTYVLFEHHEFGYKVKAVRDNEDAAESLGIDATRIKRQVYVLSCTTAAVLGGAYAFYITFVHPQEVLDSMITAQMVIMALVGGLGTILGPIIGGALIFLLDRLSALYFGSDTMYISLMGLLIMLVVLFAPDGIVGLLTGETDASDIRSNLNSLLEKFKFQ